MSRVILARDNDSVYSFGVGGCGGGGGGTVGVRREPQHASLVVAVMVWTAAGKVVAGANIIVLREAGREHCKASR